MQDGRLLKQKGRVYIVDIKSAVSYNLAGEYSKALDEISKIEHTDQFDLISLKIQTLKKMGNYSEALGVVDEAIEDKSLFSSEEITDLLELHLLKCDVLLALGKLKEVDKQLKTAKKLFDKVKKQKHESVGKYYLINGVYYNKKSDYAKSEKNLKQAKDIYSTTKTIEGVATSNFYLASNSRIQGDYERALSLSAESLNLRKKIRDIFDIATSLNQLGLTYIKLGMLDEAMNHFRECLDLRNKLGNKFELSKLMINMGIIYKIQGNLEDALSNYKAGLELFEELGIEEQISATKVNIGNIFLEQGNLNEALEYYRQVYAYFKEGGNEEMFSFLLNNMGMIYKKHGEYTEALEKYKESLEVKKRIGNRKEIAKSLQSIGTIYLYRGDLKEALEFFSKSLKDWQQTGNKDEISSILKDMGMVYYYEGNITKANNCLQESLELRRKIGNKILVAETLYYIILILLEIESDELVERYHRELKKISESVDNKNVKIQYRLASASILQKSPRIASKVEANELFEEVMAEGIVDNEFTKIAMLNLCEFLLIELKSSGDEEILQEIQSILEKLYDMATEQESHTLLIEVLIIQSKVALVTYNIAESEEYLKHAYEISDQKGLSQFSLKITYLMRQLQEETDKMSLLAQEAPIEKRLEQLDIENYIKEAAMVRDVGLDALVDPDTTNMVVHDIKNLIQVNLNFAHLLLLDKRLPDEMKKYVHFIELSTKEMQLLISSLLTTEKLENGTFNLLLEDIDAWDLILKRIDMYQFRFDQNKLSVEMDKHGRDIMVSADKFLFRRILDNLIINAGKFTPEKGSIYIRVKDDGDRWFIEFDNDCVPIPIEYHEKLFEKYEQYEVTKHTKKQGVGLGLAFCKQALESMDGSILLDSPIPGTDNGVRITLKMKKSNA
ncbi:MAG: ATP-binding protein [Candidatus Kariarchaeaceae archaeon]|jgi:signal transduction histidine kinase/Flp pilus assembly protein TadD